VCISPYTKGNEGDEGNEEECEEGCVWGKEEEQKVGKKRWERKQDKK